MFTTNEKVICSASSVVTFSANFAKLTVYTMTFSLLYAVVRFTDKTKRM